MLHGASWHRRSSERALRSTAGQMGSGRRVGGKYVEDGMGAPSWEFGAQAMSDQKGYEMIHKERLFTLSAG